VNESEIINQTKASKVFNVVMYGQVPVEMTVILVKHGCALGWQGAYKWVVNLPRGLHCRTMIQLLLHVQLKSNTVQYISDNKFSYLFLFISS